MVQLMATGSGYQIQNIAIRENTFGFLGRHGLVEGSSLQAAMLNMIKEHSFTARQVVMGISEEFSLRSLIHLPQNYSDTVIRRVASLKAEEMAPDSWHPIAYDYLVENGYLKLIVTSKLQVDLRRQLLSNTKLTLRAIDCEMTAKLRFKRLFHSNDALTRELKMPETLLKKLKQPEIENLVCGVGLAAWMM